MLIRLLLFISLFISFLVKSQTLYWVGGSGYWNDATHWSTMPGGTPSGQIPTANTNVVFDNTSSNTYGDITIHITNSAFVKTVQADNTNYKIKIIGSPNVDLHLKGAVSINEYFYFMMNGNIYLEPETPVKYNFSHNKFTNNIFLNSNYTVELGVFSTTKSISFSGNLKLKNTIITTNDFVVTNSTVDIENTTIQVKNNFNLYSSSFTNLSNRKNRFICSINGISDANRTAINNINNTVFAPFSPLACVVNLVSSTDPTCSGLCDGTAVFDLSGCTNPTYEIQWLNSDPSVPCQTLPPAELAYASSTYSVNSLCGCGTKYFVIFTNLIGDQVGIEVSIINPTPTFLTFSQTQPTCNGLCNGQVRATVFSGVTPLTLSWATPPPTSTVITHSNVITRDTLKNVCAGIYSITATNANGCVNNFTASVTQPATLITNGTSSSITCNGFCTGSATVAPTGGTGPYTYSWTPSTSTTTNIANLCPGVVSATVTDSRTCTAIFTANITQPPAITLTVNRTNLICGNICDGTASVTATGGSGGFTYTLQTPTGGSVTTNPPYSNLCAGTYTLVALNNGNCIRTQTFTITAPPTLTATPTQTNLNCFNACIGAINVNASGGTGALSYTWSPSPPTGSVVTNLCAGVYNYTVTDAANCTFSNSVTITQPPAITLTVTDTDLTCNGVCNGTGVANASGGSGAFTYSWSPGNPTGQGTSSISNLCQGSYSLTVNDGSCTATTSFSISQPAIIAANITSLSPTCNGACNGAINANPTGGIGAPYSYTLQTPGPGTITTSPPYTNLCAGNYTLIVADAGGCRRSTAISLTQPNPLTLTLTPTPLNCFGGNTGAITANPGGGTPTYTVTWAHNGLTGLSQTNLTAGTYTATVVDSRGCTTTSVTTITSPPQLTLTINSTNPNCFNQCTGVATASMSGGTPNYTVTWSNGPTGTNNPNLCAGTYTATGRDSRGCTVTQTVTITTPPAITVTIANDTVSCFGSCDGSLTANPSGGTSPFFYNWNSVPSQTTQTTLANLCPGNYNVTVTDTRGCIQSTVASVVQATVLTASISNVQPSCNVCIGSATGQGVGGTGPYTYSWSPGGQTSQTPNNLCVGIHTLTVRDSKNCVATRTVQILQTVNITITANSTTLACNNACTGMATANAVGGTGSYTFSWTPSTFTTQTANGLCAGPHTVTAIDGNGCSNTNTVSFANPPAITLTVTHTDVTCSGGATGIASATATGGTGSLTYSWQPSTGITTPSIGGLVAGDYTVTVTDVNSCSQSSVVTITESNSLTVSFTNTDPSTCTANDGSIAWIPSGGSVPYTFTLTPGSFTSSPATGLSDGTYSLVLVDGQGCTQSFTTTLSDPLGPTVAATTTSISCFNACNGVATLTITAATPSYTLNFDGPATTNTIFPGLCAGDHVASVTDENGCITNQTITINQPTQITSNGVIGNVTCNSLCTGSVNLTVSGGTPVYTYSWTNGNPAEDPTNLCLGNHTVTITDANNCVVTNSFTITQPTALALSFNKKDVLCNGDCTGTTGVDVTGGTAPYTYSWTPLGPFPGSVLDTIVNLCTGIYSVSVTDANNCTLNATVSIGEPTALTASVVSVNTKCAADCNGSAVTSANGGTAPYNFSYNTIPVTLSATVTNLCAGNYTSTVSDANGCIVTNSFVITEPLPIVITTTVTNPLCNAASNGSVVTTVSGGNPTYSYNWSPSGGTVPNPVGLSAGIYTLTVTDDSLCTGQAIVILTNPLPLLANATFTNPTCANACNGIGTVNPVGGTGSITYSWVPANSSNQTVNTLCAGINTVTVTDINGCQVTQTMTLTDPVAMTVNAAVTPATCGSSNGSIDAGAVIGGSPAYTYSWSAPVSGGQATNTVVTNLAAGVYTVVVTDATSCTATVTIPVGNADGPNGATVTSTMVSCAGLCDGDAIVSNPVGGTSPYNLSWLPATAGATLSNVCAGTYTAQVSDANSCLFFVPVTITEPQAIDDNEVLASATCFGNCNGSITLAPTGGTGAYTYSWTPGGNTTPIINDLCPGAYTSTITDVNGCTLISNYNLPSLIAITANTVATNNGCFGDCNGTALVTNVAGGTPNYSYSWTDPLGQSTNQAVGLCNGSYSVTITDANGCFNEIPVTIISPSQLTFTPNITQPSCGQCDGAATVTPTGGIPTYSIVWSNNQSGTNVSNLCAGVYGVSITDGNGCLTNTNVIINSSSTITGETITKSDVTCSGVCDGSVTITAIGGTGAITYNWVHGPIGQTLTNLCPGTYFCNMMDANGCVRTASVTIDATTTLSVTSQVTQSQCTSNTGSVTTTVTGGTGIYTYAWLPASVGSTTNTATNLAPGIYTLTVTDANGCSQQQVYAINSINGPVLTYTTQNISCAAVCDGEIDITITGGTPGYTTLWSTGASATTSVNNLCAGSYSVEVTDLAGCKAVQNFSLTTTSPIVFSLPDLNNPLCNNNCNGAITSLPSGGTLPYTYTWTTSSSTTYSAGALCSGNYSITVTDANGCTAIEDYTLTNPPAISIVASTTVSSCSTVPDGAIDITVSGGIPTYTYSWTPNGATTEDLIPTLSGNYTVTITDANGCVVDTALQIGTNLLVDAVAGNDSTFCQNATFTLNGSASVGGDSYQWQQLPSGTVISNTLVTTVTPAVGTNTYVLIATTLVGCDDRDTVVVTSNALPNVDAGPMVSIPLLTTAQIGGNPTSSTATGYTWTPNLALDNPSGTNPTTSTTVTTVYTVTVIDANGCVNFDTVTVFIYPEIRIPNGFSPNADGKNDTWIIDFIQQFPQCEVEVYNRWGEQLFYSKGYTTPWNGQYKGKNLPVGTYYYVVNLNHEDYPKPYTGPLTIFR